MVARPCHAVSLGEKPNQTPGTAASGWRRNDRKVQHSKQGDLTGIRTRHSGTKWQTGDGHNQTDLAGGPRRDPPESARKHEQTGANPEPTRPAGVRASVVARKPRNGGGAKGRRRWMTNDQTSGTQTGDSAAGSTSWSDSNRVVVGQTVRLDHSHVDGPHYGGERTEMVSVD